MEQREQLSRALQKTFWGYIFLYFDFNLGTIDVLPAWSGYFFFYQLINNILETEEESIKLLKPLCIILSIYRLIEWFIVMCGMKMDILIVSELFAVIALYFHFQFLTNLANIAHKYDCPQGKNLLTLRTIHTILMTILTFTMHFEEIESLSIIIMIAQVIIMILICTVIAKFRRFIDAIE